MTGRTILLTILAMLAFAANSLLCRMALGADLIDAASFATVRVIAGAMTLVAILVIRGGAQITSRLAWRSVLALFAYIVCFSFAYLTLGAGTGALILFGAVQLTMIAVALHGGERFAPWSFVGLSLAIVGLVWLVAPGLTAPHPGGAVLMAIAGIAWGAYTLLGRGTDDPLAATAANFLYAVPLVLIVSLIFAADLSVSVMGLIYAVASGAVASGCGYVIWYAALRGLSATRAATVQLSVPVLAAFGGVIFLGEDLTLRLILATVATLGGVALVVLQRR